MIWTRSSRRRYPFGLVLALAFVLLGAAIGWAQVGVASLSGVVEDPTGAVIPNATVTLSNAASGAEIVLKSNASGAFTFAAVPSGDYALLVNEAGFNAYVQSGHSPEPRDAIALPALVLKPGSTNETVTVTAETAGCRSIAANWLRPSPPAILTGSRLWAAMPPSCRRHCQASRSAAWVPQTPRRTSRRCRSASQRPTLPTVRQ